ncbi:MAG TPA: hypothetical protein VJB88_15390 [Vicinamibacteria bacterium]|jgi:hypothetical protein|nr:hypothetical protein [Vicinamibacteria bacterium]
MKYRIRIHVVELDPSGREKDLGPWPEHVADVRHVEDAMDLCALLSHQIDSFLFPKERAS